MNNNNSNNENEQRNIQSQPLSKKEIEKKQNHEASQDVAHTVGKGAATYFGGALGNKLYDVASKTKLGQGIEKGVGKVLESSPVAKPAMNALHKSGATKIANTAIDAFGGKKTTLNNGMSNINKGLKSTNKSLGISPQNNMTISNRGNRIVNTSGIQNEEPDFENMTEEEIENYEKQKELEEIQQKKEQKEKRDAKVKSVVKFLMKNPQIALFIGIAIFILIILIILIYMIAADMDLVGNRGVSYETADSVSGYCDQIILIKEHDDYTGDPVASIDDVNLEETFRLGNKDVKRWKYQTINLEDYVKGVLQAETSIIHDQKTYEVASIVARTYAVEITSRQCYTWDNTNKRVQYRNPQNYTSSNIDSDIAAAVSATNGLIAYDKDKIIDMSQNNYYDYFCYNKITNSKEEDKSYFEMVQENEEERLLISVDWTKDNNNVADGDAKKWGYSGKYNGGIYTNDCQEDGLSLYGAKYLLNKKQDAYTTIRILMYYYTYDLELKRIENYRYGSCGDFSLTSTTLSKNEFISLVNQYSSSYKDFQVLKSYAEQIYDISVSNNFNPELVYARAEVEGYSPGGSTYNYYGIGCTNTSKGKGCSNYSSVMDGVLAFMNIMKNYGVNTLFDVYNVKHYAYIGNYWYAGSSSSGGCYYLQHMSKYYTNLTRYNTVKSACDNGTGSTLATNSEDQEAYSHFQIEKMIDKRKKIFNIDSSNCELSSGNVNEILNSNASIGEKASQLAVAMFDNFGYSQSNRWGDNQVDCSSLVYRTYNKLGINFGGGTTVKAQYAWCKNNNRMISESQLQPGDLLFKNNLGHVEIYIGNGQRFGAHTSDLAWDKQVSVEQYKSSGYFTQFCRPY